ncbi:MAG: NAD(P)-dependent glycerol-3-phosphate dehydrogenase [Planctomycetes bacterium]|nr:NAD(P)-dependent glycerol-3-phosphate dehydrogenase [Planctomycetota bacterium]
MNFAVLGNGGFGTAMAISLQRAGHGVRLWGHDPAYTAELALTRANPRYLPDVVLPQGVQVGSDAREALRGAEAILLAVPTQHVRGVLEGLRPVVPPGVPVVSLAKGLEQRTALRPSQVVRHVLEERNPVLALSGPSHAEEVARGVPTTVVLAGASEHEAVVVRMQEALASRTFRVYRNRDLLGVEICGALKNVIALAAGIADGLGLGDNTKAAVLSRGIVEMARFGVAEGADLHTFFGLAGVGDLAVTAYSRHGRNRAFGERIGRGEAVEQILASTRKVAEGVWTAGVVHQRASDLGVDVPICDAVHAVLFGGVAPRAMVQRLMERDPRDETWT